MFGYKLQLCINVATQINLENEGSYEEKIYICLLVIRFTLFKNFAIQVSLLK